ncbi:MAG TPA: SGNH/GDSL hydrolase family protein, partial [Armatimonadota bacterium]|nr:SGNH/GDSL hydrolase family protein [Armatimonadota bacterium]
MKLGLRLFSLATLLAVAAIAGLTAAPARASQGPIDLKHVHRIVTLGDSITQGGGRPGGYVWLIDQYLQALYPEQKIEVINAGISGHKSNDMLARFQRDVLDKKPDVVTISVGINDVWHGFTPEHPAGYGPRRVPLEQYRKNVETMIQEAQKAGVKVVLFTTTIFEDQPNSIRNLRVASYNDALRDLAREYGAVLADQNAAFMAAWAKNRPSGVKLTSDQVHMAPGGDALMARTALLALGVSEKALERARP